MLLTSFAPPYSSRVDPILLLLESKETVSDNVPALPNP